MMNERKPVVVVGIGNDFRGDDGVGLVVARLLNDLNSNKVRVTCDVPDGTAILEAWTDTRLAIVVDCVSSGAAAGHVYRFDALAEPLPEVLFNRVSTHCFSLIKVIELARAVGRLPDRLLVYGIEGRGTGTGQGLSPEAERAVQTVVDQIKADIEKACN